MDRLFTLGLLLKTSFCGRYCLTKTPFGTIHMCGYRYLFGRLVRMYSVSGSSVISNAGGYTMRGLVRRIILSK